MILHSKITPERPQITPDHTRSSQNHELGTDIFSLLGLTKQFFSLLKRKAATERPFEVWGGSLGLGRGAVKTSCLTRPSKENVSQMHDFGNFWCDLGWFGDVLEWFHNAESQCVITWLNRASKVTTEYLVRFSLLGCFQFYPESISIFHISRLDQVK